jgi:6-phosphogluconate dehydrogenase
VLSARFLTYVREALLTEPPPDNLLDDLYFAGFLRHAVAPWRRVVEAAATAGFDAPTLASALKLLK